MSQWDDLVEGAKDQCAFKASCADTVVCGRWETKSFASPGSEPTTNRFNVFNRNGHDEGAQEANVPVSEITVHELEQPPQRLFDVDLPDRRFCEGPQCEDLSAKNVKPPSGRVSSKYMVEWGDANYVIVNGDDSIFIYEATGKCDVSTLMNSLTGEFFKEAEAYVDLSLIHI